MPTPAITLEQAINSQCDASGAKGLDLQAGQCNASGAEGFDLQAGLALLEERINARLELLEKRLTNAPTGSSSTSTEDRLSGQEKIDPRLQERLQMLEERVGALEPMIMGLAGVHSSNTMNQQIDSMSKELARSQALLAELDPKRSISGSDSHQELLRAQALFPKIDSERSISIRTNNKSQIQESLVALEKIVHNCEQNVYQESASFPTIQNNSRGNASFPTTNLGRFLSSVGTGRDR